MTAERTEVRQCRSCPWRVDCVPERDIPGGYSCGPGNNLGVRLAVMDGRLPVPDVDGPQHARFEDTLP